MTDKDVKKQAAFIKSKLPDILKDINDKKDAFLSKEGVFKILDYENVACFAYANFLTYKDKTVGFRIFMNVRPK